MAIIKCKICGGDIAINEEKTFGTCEYCGSTMTLPKVSDDQRAALFNRGNHFRRQGEFDKALAVYESIVREDDNDAEAHWCCALCRFGIEYVEDPATYEYIPTCHRASFDSFLDDVDYLAALEHSDGITKRQYQKDAAKIADVQKGILATSQNEEPFDVFICYKETDDNTKERTRDSIDAQEIYYQLTQEGYRVFFSRITLEDKVGAEYEPYIFAALNSAKVMVSIGSKPEYFNSVWVKNEWSRFLALMRKDRSKLLLLCYKDMDPYDLPEQLSMLQAYDMGKIGFMQDLIRGIKKIISKDEPKTTVKETVVVSGVAAGPSANTEPFLKRAFMSLEDGEWDRADEFCEQVLNIDPENAEAYLGKLMAELKVHNKDDLRNLDQPYDDNKNAQKACRFDKVVADRIKADNDEIKEKNKKKEEELRSECERIIEMLKRHQSAESIQKKIDETKDKIAELEKKIVEYNDIQNRIGIIEKELVSIRNQTDTLQTRKAKLGLFAKKEENQIDQEIVSLVEKEKTLKKEQNELEKKIAGFDSKKQLEDRINSEKDKLDKQKKEVSIYEQNRADYKNAIKKLQSDIKISNMMCEMGIIDYCYFGKYIQNKNGKAEPIEWKVLAKEKNRILVISKYALDRKPYNVEEVEVTWETCTLRKWLNNGFLKSAFSKEEQAMIETVTVSADNNPEYSTSPGNNTKDRIFLLSINEANKYFKTDKERICGGTDYAVANGEYASDKYSADGKASCWWWLRSPGYTSRNAAGVLDVGRVYLSGYSVHFGIRAVRPALWINLDS